LRQIFERARQRGEIGTGADPQFVGTALFGSVIVSALTGQPITEAAVDIMLDNVLGSLGAS